MGRHENSRASMASAAPGVGGSHARSSRDPVGWANAKATVYAATAAPMARRVLLLVGGASSIPSTGGRHRRFRGCRTYPQECLAVGRVAAGVTIRFLSR